jgi:excisionase family DNA binding protein
MNHSITRLYSVQETIELLGIKRTSLYVEIKCGRIRVKKFGNRTLIPAPEIEKWIANLPQSNGGK